MNWAIRLVALREGVKVRSITLFLMGGSGAGGA